MALLSTLLDDFIGESPALQELRNSLPLHAAGSKPVVLYGEGGTGKMLYAGHIHARSPFSAAAIRVLNFSLLPERDQRIGLLGGGFPDLSSSRRSFLAHPTTVVLKHLDSASPYLQEMLAASLRTLSLPSYGIRGRQQNIRAKILFTFRQPAGVLHRLGRIIPALAEELRGYKKVAIPPLRAHPEDIPLLAEYYLRKYSGTLLPSLNNELSRSRLYAGGCGSLNPDLIEILKQRPWPDNVRDLMAFIRDLLVVSFEEELHQRERLEVRKMITMVEEGREFSIRESLARIEEGIVRRALIRHTGCKTKAAGSLGISERAVGRKARCPKSQRDLGGGNLPL